MQIILGQQPEPRGRQSAAVPRGIGKRLSMKRFPCLLTVLIATCAPAYAQTGLVGTWRAEGIGQQPGWELFVFGDAPELRGRVNHCSTTGRANGDIYDLNVSGNTISFKCTSNDQSRTITLTGVIKGDAITFAWKKSVRTGEFDFAIDPRFGASAPPQFSVTRVPDGDLAQAARDGVLGQEFFAAVNLLPANVKARGTLFVPQKALGVRAGPVAIKVRPRQPTFRGTVAKASRNT